MRERFVGLQVEPLVRVPISIDELERRTDRLAAELAALENQIRSLENLRAYERVERSRSRHELIVTLDDGDILASNLDDRFSDEGRRALKIIQRRRFEGGVI